MQKAVAAVSLTRPYAKLWFIAAPVTTMAIWLEGGEVDLTRLCILVAALICTDAGLTTWNEIADRTTDAASTEENRSGRPLLSGTATVKAAALQVVLLELVGLVLAFVLAPAFAAMIVVVTAYAWLYAWRRDLTPTSSAFRRAIKRLMWPTVYQLFWLLIWPAMYLAVAIVLSGDLSSGWLYVAGNTLFMGVGEILAKDLRDIDNDALTEKRTTPVTLGVASTVPICVAGFALGSLVWVGASIAIDGKWNPGLTAALIVVLGLWMGRAVLLSNELRRAYSKHAAHDLQMGAIRVFLTVNLLFIAGLLG